MATTQGSSAATTKQSGPPNNLKEFQRNLRNTALGIRFAKTLFTNPASLSPMQVTTICKALGLKLSKDQMLTVAVAQLLVAGSATVKAYQAGTGASKGAMNAQNATAAAVQVVTEIGRQNGWFDDDTASIISIGTDVVLLVCSYGTNAAAWVSLCLDLGNAVATKQNLAEYRASLDLIKKVKGTIGVQGRIAGQTFKDFQEGRIGVFGLITKMAYEAPYLFPQAISDNAPLKEMFPEISLIPVVRTRIEGHGEAEQWGEWPWGGKWVMSRYTAEQHLDVNRIGKWFKSKDEAARFMWDTLVMPWCKHYYDANNELTSMFRAPINTSAILAMVGNPALELQEKFDYSGLMVGNGITPGDLGDPLLLQKISSRFINWYYKDVDKSYRETGISTGYENPGLRLINQTQKANRDWVASIEKSSDISAFIKFEPFYAALKEYFSFPMLSFERWPNGPPGYMPSQTQDGKTINSKLIATPSEAELQYSREQARAWRKINNYMSVINLVEQFRSDSYLKNTEMAQNIPTFIPSRADFEAGFKKVQMNAVLKNSQILTDNIIAAYLDIPPEKLQLLNETPEGVKTYGIKN